MNRISHPSSLDGVEMAPLLSSSIIPLVIKPTEPICDPSAWARAHAKNIDELTLEHGALLFREFPLSSAAQFEAFVDAICPEPWVEYREAATPRSKVDGHVFTSTEYPPQFRIYLHNENSHVTSWPMYVFFHCRTPAEEGGHTPIADCRRVYERLPASLLERFAEAGWLYRRNFHPGSSFTWQKTFGTDCREDVESYCRENYMVPQWRGDALTVRYRRWAALRHPRTTQMLWFNHGTFFNPHTLEPALRDAVLAMGEDRMPYNTYFGDGAPIDEETIGILDAAYASETVSFPWQSGDVLMLDNMRIAHGRTSFRGRREVLVTMKRKVQCTELASYEQYSPPASPTTALSPPRRSMLRP